MGPLSKQGSECYHSSGIATNYRNDHIVQVDRRRPCEHRAESTNESTTQMSSQFDPDFVAVIRCPVTKSPLSSAPESVIERLNQQIEAGTLVDCIGQTVNIKLDGGFINEDQSLLLPVRGGIVILIGDQAIGLNGILD